MRFAYLVVSVGLATFVACGEDLTGVVTDRPSRPMEELRSAPKEVVIEGAPLALSSYVWRDFMPGTDDSSMTVAARLSSENGVLVEQSTLRRIWVIQSDVAWQTTFSEIRPPAQQQEFLEGVARNGPRWATGSTVTVVVEAIVRGDTLLLGVPDVEIERAE